MNYLKLARFLSELPRNNDVNIYYPEGFGEVIDFLIQKLIEENDVKTFIPQQDEFFVEDRQSAWTHCTECGKYRHRHFNMVSLRPTHVNVLVNAPLNVHSVSVYLDLEKLETVIGGSEIFMENVVEAFIKILHRTARNRANACHCDREPEESL